MFLWDMCSALLLFEPAKGKPCPSAWAEALGPWALGSAPVAGQERPGPERLEEAATLLTSHNSFTKCQKRRLSFSFMLNFIKAIQMGISLIISVNIGISAFMRKILGAPHVPFHCKHSGTEVFPSQDFMILTISSPLNKFTH